MDEGTFLSLESIYYTTLALGLVLHPFLTNNLNNINYDIQPWNSYSWSGSKGKMEFEEGFNFLDGYRITGSEPGLVLKHFQRFLQNRKHLQHKNITPFYDAPSNRCGFPLMPPTWVQLGTAAVGLDRDIRGIMSIITGISEGIEYLHQHSVVHGDIRASNILIDDIGNARVSNFGISTFLESGVDLRDSTPFTARWMAPELLVWDGPRTKATDVYAFASTVLELLTDQIPYGTMSDKLVLLKVMGGISPRHLTGDFRYEVPYAEKLWQLLEKCWADAEQRPSIAEVRKELQAIDINSRAAG